MRVLCLPADSTGCGHFRMIWVARQLANQGHDVQLMMPEQRNLKIVTDGEHVAEVHLTRDDADVIVLQRVTHPLVAAAIPVIRANGVAVVVDVDDDLSAVHPRNPAYAAMHPAGRSGRAPEQKRHSWHHLTAACRDATWVTVSTPALLDTYAPHGRGSVLPNVLPEIYFQQTRRDSAVIGWPASIQTHPDDPAVTGGAIARLVAEGEDFKVMADPTTTGAAFGLPADPPGRPGIALADWPAAVAELGVGIAPLTDTRFNAAKSWLKPLEMAALGVPVVMSPRPEYQRLHALGVGVLAGRPRAWYRELRRLVDSEAARLELSQQGRAAVDDLRVTTQAWRWMEAWEQAARTQQGARPVAVVG